MKAVKDTLRASKLAMTLPNNFSQAISSVAHQSPQLHEGRSVYPQPSHRTVFRRYVVPEGTNILSPDSLSTVATSMPPSVPSAGVSVGLGGTDTSHHQSPLNAGAMAMSLPPSAPSACTKSHITVGDTDISWPIFPPTRDLNASQTLYSQTPVSPTAACVSAVECHPHPPLSPATIVSDSTSQPPPKSLTIKHMADVCKYLLPLRARWKIIGTLLCVEQNTLDAIKADSDNCGEMLTGLIAEWLKRREPPPTWQALADAVQHISPDKAKEIGQAM